MAFGFTPKHVEELYLDKFSHEQFLAAAVETANRIGWKIQFMSENGFIAYTNKGILKWNAQITLKLEADRAFIKSESTGSEMMDLGKNKKTVRQFVDELTEIKYSLPPGELEKKFEELKSSFAPKEEDVLIQPPATTAQKVTDFFSIFKPRPGYFVTPILVDINILIFLLMVLTGVNILQPDNESLIKWGANFRPVTLQGEWWRLITNCFLHIGIIHLLLNMYALIYIGLLLEPHLGRMKFTVAYFLAGVAASTSSLWWHDLTISAGASGAIFGMYGVFLAMLTTNLMEKKTRKPLLISIGVFVFYNLAYGMKGGIDNAAHIGGLLAGILIGYAYYPSLKKPDQSDLRYAVAGLSAISITAISFFVYKNIPNDIARYSEKMKSFAAMEQAALGIYRMPLTEPKEKLLSEVKDSGFYYWNESKKLIAEMEKLNIPSAFHEKNKLLFQYCDLRLKAYNLIYKTILEDTDIYTDSLKAYNGEIEVLIDGLKNK